MWAQILQEGDGVTAEIDFERGTTATARIGKTRHLSADIEPLWGGWYRVSVNGTLPGGPTSVMFHMLGADGGIEFEPDGQAITLSRIELGNRQTEANATGQP